MDIFRIDLSVLRAIQFEMESNDGPLHILRRVGLACKGELRHAGPSK